MRRSQLPAVITVVLLASCTLAASSARAAEPQRPRARGAPAKPEPPPAAEAPARPSPPALEPPPPPSGRPIKLLEAVQRALADNPRLRAAELDVLDATAAIAEAGAALDTALSLRADGFCERAPNPSTVEAVSESAAFSGAASYVHRLMHGTTIGVSLEHRIQSQPSVFAVLLPQFATDLTLAVDQPLLRGAGTTISNAPILAAEVGRNAARLLLERTREITASTVALLYWQLALAQAEAKIQRGSLERASRLESLTQQLITRGVLPEVASIQARSTVALRTARVLAAERQRQNASNGLAVAMSDPTAIDLLASEEPGPPGPVPAAADDLKKRADIAAAELQIAAGEQLALLAHDRAEPELSVGLVASLQGLAGSPNERGCSLLAAGGGPLPAGCLADGKLSGGFPGSFRTLLTGGYFTVGLRAAVALPIKNEAALGTAERADIAVRRAKQRLAEQHTTAVAELRGLVELAEVDALGYEAAARARQLATELFASEEQKYQFGASTILDVLRVQDELLEAELVEVRARASAAITGVQVATARGSILDLLGVRAGSP